jgi:hypothetical protein
VTSVLLDQRLVTNALLAVLRATDIPVGDGFAPVPPEGDPAYQWYATLLHLNGGPAGGAKPETEMWLEYRVRSVGVDPSKVGGRLGPRMDAEGTATRLRRTLLDRATKIEGTGWRITGREWMSSASDAEGRIVNVSDDFRFRVSPRTA